MKALTFKRYGKSPEIGFTDVPRPTLKPDELLVQVHAASVNPVDNMILAGVFKPILYFQLPATLGSDLAGVVTEVGSRVTRFKPGDAVFANIFDRGTGAIAEFAVVPENLAAPKPKNLDFVQAASIPMVGLTSWQALKERANLRSGQKVFIPAGSGGIGTFAIQLAKHLGATVATTASAGNAALVKGLCADVIIDYKTQDFEDVLSNVDVVLHSQDGKTLEKSLRLLKSGGQLVSISGPPDPAFAQAIGASALVKLAAHLLSAGTRRRARGRGVGYSFLFMQPSGSQLREITRLIETGVIRPVIDKVFPFESTNEALVHVDSGRAKGKVVIQVR